MISIIVQKLEQFFFPFSNAFISLLEADAMAESDLGLHGFLRQNLIWVYTDF